MAEARRNGHNAYVTKHFGDVSSDTRKPEHALLAAYFNLDNGSGRIRGVNLQGNEAAMRDQMMPRPVPPPRSGSAGRVRSGW